MSPSNTPANNKTVLLVDDDVAMQGALAFSFKRKGYQVLTAGSGSEAFELLKKSAVDLVVSDIRMQQGDGIELLQWIRALDHQLPPVIFISGFAELQLEDAYDLGVEAVFSKPFDQNELYAAVSRSLMSSIVRWSDKADPDGAETRIDLEFPDFQKAIDSRVLSFGRGGMFVSMAAPLPIADTQVGFKIRFGNGPLAVLEGCGLVKWVRLASNGNLPAGCGIEFQSLAVQSGESLRALIDATKIKAYIPKR